MCLENIPLLKIELEDYMVTVMMSQFLKVYMYLVSEFFLQIFPCNFWLMTGEYPKMCQMYIFVGCEDIIFMIKIFQDISLPSSYILSSSIVL